jgi:hypothetical protein
MDPGTCLAVVSIALELSKGLYAYYEHWRDCNQDVQDLRASLLQLSNIFVQLEETLRRPHLEKKIVSTVAVSMKACKNSIEELQQLLNDVQEQGTSKTLLDKLKANSRRALYPFRASTVARIAEVVQDIKDDLGLAVEVLALDTSAKMLDEIDILGESIRQADSNFTRIGEDIISKIEDTNSNLQNQYDEQQRKQIVDWLEPPDHTIAHNVACDRCQAGTGAWFTESQQFQNWAKEPSKLWLHGAGESL